MRRFFRFSSFPQPLSVTLYAVILKALSDLITAGVRNWIYLIPPCAILCLCFQDYQPLNIAYWMLIHDVNSLISVTFVSPLKNKTKLTHSCVDHFLWLYWIKRAYFEECFKLIVKWFVLSVARIRSLFYYFLHDLIWLKVSHRQDMHILLQYKFILFLSLQGRRS